MPKKNWEDWNEFFNDQMIPDTEVRINEATVAGFAEKIGSYFSGHVDLQTDQERIMADLWHAASESERCVLVHLMLKLVTSHLHN
ncbi:MAG: DUF3243 family protein [Sporolactobacillus sp.]